MRHMDDFVVIGERPDVRSLLNDLAQTLMVTGTEILEEVGQVIQILGTVVEKTGRVRDLTGGVTYQRDH